MHHADLVPDTCNIRGLAQFGERVAGLFLGFQRLGVASLTVTHRAELKLSGGNLPRIVQRFCALDFFLVGLGGGIELAHGQETVALFGQRNGCHTLCRAVVPGLVNGFEAALCLLK